VLVLATVVTLTLTQAQLGDLGVDILGVEANDQVP
jgi:hypothetical protein